MIVAIGLFNLTFHYILGIIPVGPMLYLDFFIVWKNPPTQDLTQMDGISTVDFQGFLRF